MICFQASYEINLDFKAINDIEIHFHADQLEKFQAILFFKLFIDQSILATSSY